jgi:hypothetical protein
MSEMREWILVGVFGACICFLAGCASPEPAAPPPKPQLMNGFYIEKSPGTPPQRAKPTDTTTASQPAVLPVAAPVSEPQPAPAEPQPAVVPPPPSGAVPSDASQFIEPPSR